MDPQATPMNMALQKLRSPQLVDPTQQAPQDGGQSQAPGIVDALNKQIQEGGQALDQERKNQDDQTLQTPSSQQRASLSRAMGMLTPANTKSVPAQIGKSIATPSYAGYCLQFVDDQQGNTNRQPTAYADYQVRAQSGNISTNGTPPKGARVYFAPDNSNGGMGHVGISNGNGSFTSATDNGVKTYALKDWESATGQQFIGYSKGK